MKYISDTFGAIKEVYRSGWYILLSSLFAFAIFSSHAVLINYKLLFSQFSLKLFLSLIFGLFVSTATSSLIFLILVAFLGGMVLAMSIFLIRRQIRGSVGAGSAGIIAGLLAPACPSCALGLLSVVGIGGFLLALPFKGLELGVLGIVILVVSMVYLSGKIRATVCEVKK
jgi:hypothetical protein